MRTTLTNAPAMVAPSIPSPSAFTIILINHPFPGQGSYLNLTSMGVVVVVVVDDDDDDGGVVIIIVEP